MNPDRLQAAYLKARDTLLAERTADGHWVGELSSSALSTATAIAALKIAAPNNRLITNGFRWLVEHQNADGGWGDTVKSFSNISTTMLCRAAFHIGDVAAKFPQVLRRCEAWLAERYGKTPSELAESVRMRYGKDGSFAVPILTMCAIGGLVPWNEVPRLPFELACLPQSWYRFARLPVVSYALPALIAIGHCIHHHRSTWNPITRILRRMGKSRSLRVLESIQPTSGGYLEATPLTSFVVMSLASTPRTSSGQRVIDKGIEFIIRSARADGSWPIDTNLATWVTTLSINALAAAGDMASLDRRDGLLAWLMSQQMKVRHPYTGADPGGWGWTDLPGSVPDCDDTPGAVLAIRQLDSSAETLGHLRQAERWMHNLQNRDGGIPTFCRGWGTLPFDRSGTDLTAHVLRALKLLNGDMDSNAAMLDKSWRYLETQQRADGSWLPLWFGNQHGPDDINPVYGTAKVLAAYRDFGKHDCDAARKGVDFLLATQNADGGWGGAKDSPSSVEETALAVEVLYDQAWWAVAGAAVAKGIEYLVSRVENGSFIEPSPIGFYFAKLWYFEKLYPIVFTVAALGRRLQSGG